MTRRLPLRRRRACAPRTLCAALLLSAASALSPAANAAGLFFSDRGVRPLGRGGAFTAGADDLGAITYNPAGVADAKTQFLFDMSWMHFTSDFQRVALVSQVDPNTGQPTGASWNRSYDPVHGTSPILPIPTLAYSNNLGIEKANFAVGVWAPYAAITSYPEATGGVPSPQRYSLITLEGSALAILSLTGAYRFSDEFAIGASAQVLAGNFNSSVAFTACPPDRIVCPVESPEYDAVSQLKVGTIVAPSGNLGATWSPSPDVRIGGSFQLPFWINVPATVKVRLPSAPLFDTASQSGDSGHVKFRLPWILRTGIEYRGIPETRVELSWVYEAWSMHDAIEMTPDDIVLNNVVAFPAKYRIGALSIPRNFKDTWSVRLGGEHKLSVSAYKLDLRAGVMYEPSAVPSAQLSVLTVDLDKVTMTIGGSLHINKKWRFDGVYAHIFGFTKDVSTSEAAVAQINPVRANPAPSADIVNAGHYEARADVLGVGLRYQFE